MHLTDPRTYGVAVLVVSGLMSGAIHILKFLEWKASRKPL